jgi:hypothetical protein
MAHFRPEHNQPWNHGRLKRQTKLHQTDYNSNKSRLLPFTKQLHKTRDFVIDDDHQYGWILRVLQDERL